MLLVAWDGEWTRRRVPSPQWAYSFAESMQIPGYDALVVGYPQRMRDYNTRLTRKMEERSSPAPGRQRPGPWSPGFADAAGEKREFTDDLEEEFRLPPSRPGRSVEDWRDPPTSSGHHRHRAAVSYAAERGLPEGSNQHSADARATSVRTP